MPAGTDIIYRVNAADEISFTNRQYDEFARENDGEKALSTAVLHCSLWSFITEPTTQNLYREVLRRVRDGRSIQFTFRCDSPACRRLMEMIVVSTDAEGVEFRTRALLEESRHPQTVLQHHARSSGEFLRMCAWCNAMNADGDWVEVEEAALRLRLFEYSCLPTVTHGICDACFTKMKRTLSEPPNTA